MGLAQAPEPLVKKEYNFFFDQSVRSDDIEKIETFYRRYGTVNITNMYGESLLQLACKYNATKIFNFIVDDCSIDIDYTDNSGCTALHYACEVGNLSMVKVLLEKGKYGSKNAETSTGMTPFLLACREGHADVVEWLYDSAGPRIDINHCDYVSKMCGARLAVFFKREGVKEFFKRRIFSCIH